MKESIYTIPISEAFEPKCGCPMCSIYETLEQRWAEYITGAAMMEPDIRIETNKHGFCARHFERMLGQRNRLSVALILQTRLSHINSTLTDPPPKKGWFTASKSTVLPKDDCFVCLKIDAELARVSGNIAVVWARDTGFRELFAAQEFLCYPHYRLLALAAGKLRGKQAKAFIQASAELTRKRLIPCKDGIDAFCNLFDYRSDSSKQPDDAVSGAIEAAIGYHTGKSGRG